MINRIEKLADTVKTESRQLADRAIKGLRTAGLETAGIISKTKKPVHAIAETGLKLNTLSHKSIEKLVKQQVATIDDLIDGSAERLEKAARARTMRTLVEGQISTLPQARKHAVKNAKKTVTLVRETGDAFGDLFKDVVVDISSARKPAAKKKTAGRKKTAASKKAKGRKPAAKKTAAKKRVARKAPVKKAAPKAAEAAQAA